MTSEDLWRAALHDFNNLLAGLQGVLDLSDPSLPLDARNRLRLESTLEDGKTLIAMARFLALKRIPDSGMASWPEWKAGLDERMGPASTLFRCPIELVDAGASDSPWPAPLLQDWIAAFTRQVLPWAAPGPLRVEASASEDAWTLTWVGEVPIPVALKAGPSPETPKNLPSFWLRAAGEHLGVSIQETPQGVVARLERS